MLNFYIDKPFKGKPRPEGAHSVESKNDKDLQCTDLKRGYFLRAVNISF